MNKKEIEKEIELAKKYGHHCPWCNAVLHNDEDKAEHVMRAHPNEFSYIFAVARMCMKNQAYQKIKKLIKIQNVS